MLDFTVRDTLFERLINIYEEHKKLIIAYDIDDTVRPFRSNDKACKKVRDLIREVNSLIECEFIVFTANSNVDAVIEYLNKENLPFSKINENIDKFKTSKFNQGKVYCNIQLDDKAGLAESFNALSKFIKYIKNEKETPTNKFSIICEECGSKNIEISYDTDYKFNGENEYLENTGYLSCICKDCHNYQIVDFVNKHY